MSDNRPIVYTEGPWVIYRASSIGKPTRCLAAAREGAEPLPAPQYLIEAAEAGNRYEVIVKDRLREQGWQIPEVGEQEFVEVVVREPTSDSMGIKVRGHLDGSSCIEPDSDIDTMLEVKSMSATVFEEWRKFRFERFPEYAAQLTCYMTATGKPATYAVVCRDDPDGEERIETRFVPEPPEQFDRLAQKTLIVEAFFERGTLPTCDGTSKYQCPYSYLCDADTLLFAEVESGTDEVFEHLLASYAEVGKLIEELKASRDGIRAELEDALGERRSHKVNGWNVVRVPPGTSSRINTSRLRDALGDKLDEFYDETPRAGYLRVTPPKK